MPKSGTTEAKLAFVGTVRPHKNVLPAAKAIGMVNWSQGRNVRLHVLGDVSPPELRAELKLNGAVVGGIIPASMLPQRLSGMDCLLAGFPSDAAADDSITRYQISAKIGDALAVGKPILVPESDSVRDLAGVPGIYLFNQGNFAAQLGAALDSEERIGLPDSFTPAGAAASFDQALAGGRDQPAGGAGPRVRREPLTTRQEAPVAQRDGAAADLEAARRRTLRPSGRPARARVQAPAPHVGGGRAGAAALAATSGATPTWRTTSPRTRRRSFGSAPRSAATVTSTGMV